jgi:hypothetical protein
MTTAILAKGAALMLAPVVGYVAAKMFMGRFYGRQKPKDPKDNTDKKDD